MKREDTSLAAIAGYVDTLSFVALFGLFTAHVTGNFVLIGAGTAGFGQGVFMKLMAFPAFVVGVVITSVIARSAPAAPGRAAWRIYAVQAALMLAFCVAGIGAVPIVHPENTSVIVCAMLGAAAMGVRNARDRLVSRPGSVPNTVMTGNVTQVMLDAFEVLTPSTSPEAKATSRARLERMVPAVVAFAWGAVAGALAYRRVGFMALLLPFAALLWLTFNTWRTQPAVADLKAATDARK